jgi:hypothetical protein
MAVPLESLGFYDTSEMVAIVILHVPTRDKVRPTICVSLNDPKRKHNNFTAVVYKGDTVHGCDLSFTPGVRAPQQAAKAARVSPGGRPRRNRVGVSHGHGNRIARLHHSSRLERVPLRTYTSSPAHLAPIPGD